jgi:predicted MPP superfamily phosphohydrolase
MILYKLFSLLEMFVSSDAKSPRGDLSAFRVLAPTVLTLLLVYYLGKRLTSKTNFNKKIKFFIWFFLFVSIYSFPLIFFSGIISSFTTGISIVIYAITSCLWGFFAYIFFLIFFHDIFTAPVKLGRFIYKRIKNDRTKPDDKKNSQFKYNTIRTIVIISTAFIFFFIGFIQAINQPDFISRTINFGKDPGVANKIRIAHLSDLHINPLLGEDWVKSIIKNTKEAKPDIVVITGDFVDGKAQYNKNYIRLFEEITSPVFFISGNHELIWGIDDWRAAIEESSMNLLDERREILEVNGIRILIAGIGDRGGGAWMFRVPSDFKDLLKDAPPSDLKILLSHRPEIFSLAAESGFDLVLAGHTHAGQTFPLNLFAKLITQYPKGFYKKGKTILFTSPGAGYVGPPIRLFVPKEVTILDINVYN